MRRSARQPVPGPEAGPPPREPLAPPPEGVGYRASPPGAEAARRLFRFAGAWAPPPAPDELAWEAEAGGRLIGAVLVERHGAVGMVHGPVVVEAPPGVELLDVAARLVALVLEPGPGAPDTLFARPQGLDRVWVRFGFVPIPEAALPAGLRGRPGTGLYVWRRPGTYAIAAPSPGEDAERRRR